MTFVLGVFFCRRYFCSRARKRVRSFGSSTSVLITNTVARGSSKNHVYVLLFARVSLDRSRYGLVSVQCSKKDGGYPPSGHRVGKWRREEQTKKEERNSHRRRREKNAQSPKRFIIYYFFLYFLPTVTRSSGDIAPSEKRWYWSFIALDSERIFYSFQIKRLLRRVYIPSNNNIQIALARTKSNYCSSPRGWPQWIARVLITPSCSAKLSTPFRGPLCDASTADTHTRAQAVVSSAPDLPQAEERLSIL